MNVPTSFPTISPTTHDTADTSVEAIIIASLSIFFYGILAIAAGLLYLKFRKVKSVTEDRTPLVRAISGKYDHAKRLFFAVLSISALLDIPIYLGCLANGGPSNCDWKAADQLFFWFLHLIALCGYAYCIIIPCILWSDMMNKKDGRLFFSEYPYGYLKQYFRLLILLYLFNTGMDILFCAAYWRQSDRLHYRDSPSYTICALIESILIVCISFGCFYCGIRLQLFVHQAKLKSRIELQFLCTLNMILGMIVISLLGRAIFVFRLEPGLSNNMKFRISYTISTLIARWIPDIFCQFALVYIMRLSAIEITKKYRSSKKKSSRKRSKMIARFKQAFFFQQLSDVEHNNGDIEDFHTGISPSLERVSLWGTDEMIMDFNSRKTLSEELLLHEVIGESREIQSSGYYEASSVSEESEREDSISYSFLDSEDQTSLFEQRLVSTEDSDIGVDRRTSRLVDLSGNSEGRDII